MRTMSNYCQKVKLIKGSNEYSLPAARLASDPNSDLPYLDEVKYNAKWNTSVPPADVKE